MSGFDIMASLFPGRTLKNAIALILSSQDTLICSLILKQPLMSIMDQIDPPWQTENIFVLFNEFEMLCFPATGIFFTCKCYKAMKIYPFYQSLLEWRSAAVPTRPKQMERNHFEYNVHFAKIYLFYDSCNCNSNVSSNTVLISKFNYVYSSCQLECSLFSIIYFIFELVILTFNLVFLQAIFCLEK